MLVKLFLFYICTCVPYFVVILSTNVLVRTPSGFEPLHHTFLQSVEDPGQSYRRADFIQELHFLHPYTDTFLNMLSDVKARNESVSLADPRTYMYR